jgi:hypothetical protein
MTAAGFIGIRTRFVVTGAAMAKYRRAWLTGG